MLGSKRRPISTIARLRLIACLAPLLGAAPFASAAALRVAKEGPSGRVYAPCALDGVSTECFLDTGANSSTVPDRPPWNAYPGKPGHSRSASGHVEECRSIVIDKIRVSNWSLEKLDVLRCSTVAVSEPQIGLDVFRGRIVELDLQKKILRGLERIPTRLQTQKLLDNGKALFIPVSIDGKISDAMFDTGATLSVVDREFVKKNPGLFTSVGDVDSGKDGANVKMDARLYYLKEATIGGKDFRQVETVAISFEQFKDVLPPGSYFVAGYSVIRRARWYLDLKNGNWALR